MTTRTAETSPLIHARVAGLRARQIKESLPSTQVAMLTFCEGESMRSNAAAEEGLN